jgi:hypothetical protein
VLLKKLENHKKMGMKYTSLTSLEQVVDVPNAKESVTHFANMQIHDHGTNTETILRYRLIMCTCSGLWNRNVNSSLNIHRIVEHHVNGKT